MRHQENLRLLLGINWHSYYHLSFELNVTEAARIPGLAVVTSRWVLLNGTYLSLMSGRLYRQCLNLFYIRCKCGCFYITKIVTIFRNICREMNILEDSPSIMFLTPFVGDVVDCRIVKLQPAPSPYFFLCWWISTIQKYQRLLELH